MLSYLGKNRELFTQLTNKFTTAFFYHIVYWLKLTFVIIRIWYDILFQKHTYFRFMFFTIPQRSNVSRIVVIHYIILIVTLKKVRLEALGPLICYIYPIFHRYCYRTPVRLLPHMPIARTCRIYFPIQTSLFH